VRPYLLHGRADLVASTWFKKNTGEINLRSRDDPFDIKRNHGKTEIRNNFFSIRVIDGWNTIPAEMKKIEKLERFKREYRKLWGNR